MMPGVSDRYWAASTLQGRRWMMERRLEAVEENDVNKLQKLLVGQGRTKPRELTAGLEIALSKRSDDYRDIVELLLGNGANPDGTNGSGTPFLHLAADAGTTDILQILLKHKPLLQQSRDDGASALHRAAWRGHVTCVQMLLDAGCDVDARDALGRTPLISAAQANNSECMFLLINNGSSINALDNNGMSILAWSVHYNNMRMFIATVADNLPAVVNSQNPRGQTPLMLAVCNNNCVMCEHLLDHGASPNIVDDQGSTALNLAARNSRLDIIDLLAARGSDANISDIQSVTPIYHVLPHSDTLKVLLNAGADPNIHHEQYDSPLWTCCSANYIISTKLLLQGNADPTRAGNPDKPRLPLRHALYQGYNPIVKMLIIAYAAMGADLSWVRAYIREENFQRQIQSNSLVAGSAIWIDDVTADLSNPCTLQCYCRMFLRRYLGSRRFWKRAGQLHLPSRLTCFLRLTELDEVVEKYT